MNYPHLSGRSALFILVLCLAGMVVPASALTLTPGVSSSSNSISNGDPVYVTGIATGHPRDGLQVWLIGYNTAKVTSVAVNDDNTYMYELKSSDTKNLASGQYLVIVQHPMMNGQFDIIYDSSTGKVINRQLGSSGTSIFQLTRGGSLQSTDASSALMKAISSQDIDDTFATASFSISLPDAFIHPVGDHVVGETFTISGSTNLAAGDQLQVDVYSSSFVPTKKNQNGEYSGASGVVEVMSGTSGRNMWSFTVDASGFRPDEYIVTVSGILQNVKGSATFNIVPLLSPATQLPETTSIVLQETAPVTSVQTTVSPPAVVTTTRQSALPLWMSAGAVLGIILVVNKKRSLEKSIRKRDD